MAFKTFYLKRIIAQGTKETIDNQSVGIDAESSFKRTDLKSASTYIILKIMNICVTQIRVKHTKTKKKLSTYDILNNYIQSCFQA